MPQFVKTLKPGVVLRGAKYIYTIEEPEQQDGFGITYRATGVPVESEPAARGTGPAAPRKFIVREHFMYHCSERDDNDEELAIDEFSESTVNDFQEVFKTMMTKIQKATQGMDMFLKVIEEFETNGTYYYSTEYLEGPTLREYIEQHGRVQLSEAKKLIEPIFVAARRFHTQHIIHTALSPDSIVIESLPDGKIRPVLTQLYSCKIFSRHSQGRLQLPPLSCPDCYAPREQYGEMEKFMPQTNVYSLAAILMFVLTGEDPPEADNMDEETITEMIQNLHEDVPITFREALHKALNPDWHERFESVSLFNNSLLSSIYTEADRKRDEQRNAPENKRLRAWRTWIIIAVLVALIATLVTVMIEVA